MRIVTSGVGLLSALVTAAVVAQVAPPVLSPEQVAAQYESHDKRVLQMLPPESGLPPLLDLSRFQNSPTEGANKKWEERFSGSMGVRPIDDPGMRSIEQVTSISTTTTEYAGASQPLPARSCELILIGRPQQASAHLAHNRRFVYSLYETQIEQILKGRFDKKFNRIIQTAQLGGSIPFPSGHQTFFWEANDGFMALGERYLLFLWQPVRSSDIYMVADVYLLKAGVVFPIMLSFGESRYSKMPADEFICRVKALIAADRDGS
jgi:hypothetical protein